MLDLTGGDTAACAEQLARGITHPYFQGPALEAVVEALVQAGANDHAEQLARTITDPDSQARALVAVALAQADSSTVANRLLGAALSVGDWGRLPLCVVADMSSDAIWAIADAIASDWEG
ncbi:hypothetical protein [Frankia tisae]|uniref:hypothetical protein n=1 Tax=Frankia tisae TaxID=2950104 RepID=UPI0021C00A34|nr:hypothetical protein [Frankia tisae]